MKRVGILTFSRTLNCGTELQAFALTKKLAEHGFDAEVIDYANELPSKWQRLISGALKRVLHGEWRLFFDLLKRYFKGHSQQAEVPDNWYSHLKLKRERFAAFNKDMRFSATKYTAEQLYANSPSYDVYIVGSDQIWNYWLTRYVDIYLLCFVKNATRRIAYAASLGVKRIQLSRRRLYRRALRRFHHISVREKDSIPIVEELSGQCVQHVVDPTLLMDADEWRKESVPVEFPPSYVLLYSMSNAPTILGHAYSFAKQLQIPLITICQYYDENAYPGTIIWQKAGPREFLTLLANARLVVTDSFHGTAFSINFGVNFMALVFSHWEHNNRIQGVCSDFGIEDHFVQEQGVPLSIPRNIDYSRVHALLAEKRAQSLAWLRSSLEP